MIVLSFFSLYLVLITPHHHHFAAFSKVDVFPDRGTKDVCNTCAGTVIFSVYLNIVFSYS